jgi:hypothetical protein
MLSLQDCIAMADIPVDKLLELAKREHLPVMLAVAMASQRDRHVDWQRSGGTSAPAGQSTRVADHATRKHRPSPLPE